MVRGVGRKKAVCLSVKLYTFRRNNRKCLLNNYLSHVLAIRAQFGYNSIIRGRAPNASETLVQKLKA